MQTASPYSKRLFTGTSLLVLLFLIPTLVACSNRNSTSSTGITPTPHHTTGATPGVLLGVQPCPGAIKDPAHWNPIIPIQSGVSIVESVSCGNLTGNPSLQALVTVRHNGSASLLDAYVYTKITGARPLQLFKLQGLYKGEAKISAYNTVITGEVDQNSRINLHKDNASLAQDLFREFKWSDGAGTLVQIAFPGIFPDLTRFQAEADQAQVNQGHQPWKLSPTLVANALAVSLLKWSPASSTTLLSGGGSRDSSAVVSVQSSAAVSGKIKVTLYRLEENTNGGIWEAVDVAAGGMSITNPGQLALLSSPVNVKGTGNAFEGQAGQVIVLDHLYTNIGQAGAIGVAGMGNTSFSTSVSYQSTFHAGSQEGVLVLNAYSNANGSIAAAVMVKALVSSSTPA